MDYEYQYSNKIGLAWVIKNLPGFLFPNIAKKKDRIEKLFNGVIATADKKPIGLVLSSFDQEGISVRVHSLYVHPDHRDQHVATQLMKRLEEALKKEDAKRLELHFRSHWTSVSHLKQLLENLQWSTPKEELVLVKGKAQKALAVFSADVNLPKGYKFKPWVMVSQAEREQIKERKKSENWYLDYLDPFVMEETINTYTSLALLYNDELIGWVITHKISAKTNEFTALFVDGNHRLFKLSHLLMREAIIRQIDQQMPDYLITARAENKIMSRFILRHAAHTDLLTRSYKSVKEL